MPNRVLVVQDHRTKAPRIHLELARMGLEVELVDTGEICLEVARALLPAAIILDVELPDIDGYSLCRQLKSDPGTATIPVLLLTRREQVGDGALSRLAGADDYIVKDHFTEHNLLVALRHLGLM